MGASVTPRLSWRIQTDGWWVCDEGGRISPRRGAEGGRRWRIGDDEGETDTLAEAMRAAGDAWRATLGSANG